MYNRLQVEEFMKKYNLKPMDISQERFDKYIEDYFTYDVFVNRALFKSVIMPFLMVDGEINYAFYEKPNELYNLYVITEDYKLHLIKEEDIKYIYLKNSKIFNIRLYEYIVKENGGKIPTKEEISEYL